MNQLPSMGIVAVVTLGTLGACGSSKSSASTLPANGGSSDCDAAADTAAKISAEVQHEEITADELARGSAAMRSSLGTSCREDGWPPEHIACFTKATSTDDLTVCKAQLTPEQVSGFKTRFEAEFGDDSVEPEFGDDGAQADPDDGGE